MLAGADDAVTAGVGLSEAVELHATTVMGRVTAAAIAAIRVGTVVEKDIVVS